MKTYSAEINQLILILRFHNVTPTKQSKIYEKFDTIQNLLHVPISYARKVCQQAVGPINQKSQKYCSYQRGLSSEQKQYLISNEALNKLKGLSLYSRAIICHRNFPQRPAAAHQIGYIYKKNKIKYKIMKSDYQLSQKKLEQIDIIKKERFLQLIRVNEKKSKIIYIDEAIFKAYQINYKTQSKEKQNIVMAKEGTQITTMAAIICISNTQGLEGYCIKPRSINIQDLRDTIEYISLRNQQQGITIFWDNLRAHHNKQLIQDIKCRGWQIIYNAPYSCNYHCIEEVFSQIKIFYKKKIILQNFQINNREHTKIIQESIEIINKELVRKVEQRHFEKMQKFIEQC